MEEGRVLRLHRMIHERMKMPLLSRRNEHSYRRARSGRIAIITSMEAGGCHARRLIRIVRM